MFGFWGQKESGTTQSVARDGPEVRRADTDEIPSMRRSRARSPI
jgi:hypothetical protein